MNSTINYNIINSEMIKYSKEPRNKDFVFFGAISFYTKCEKNKKTGESKETKKFILKTGESWKLLTKSNIVPEHKAMAIVTGKKSNLTVYDFDDKNEYKKLMLKYPKLKKCRTIKTNKGYHIYFNYNYICPNTTNILTNYKNVDIRNDGGIIYCAPSKYKLLNGEIKSYDDLGGELIDVPQYLIDEIKIKTSDESEENKKPKDKKNKQNKQNKKDILDSTPKLKINFYSESNIEKEGKTLGEKMTMDEIRNLKDEYKRYLYLIPSQSNRNVWCTIGMAIKSCSNGLHNGLNDFIKFSKLNNKYDDKIDGEQYESFNLGDGRHWYGLTHLKKLCRLCNADNYKKLVKSELFEYFELDLQKINLIEDKGITEKNYVNWKLMLNDNKMQIISACMGGGKTFGIKQYLNKINFKKILFVSPRKSFSDFIEGEFKEFGINNYQDKKIDINNCDRLVIQMESLHKLNDNNNFDIIIMDECESSLKQFSSQTMSFPLKVFNTLQKKIIHADKIIYADAFLSNRSLDYVKSFNEEITFIKNLKLPEKRNAIEIEGDDKFDDEIINSVENKNENVFVVYNNKTKLITFESNIKLLQKRVETWKNKKALYYHANKSDKMGEDLKEVNKVWNLQNLVCVSPKITVGVSFTERHFDTLYIKASSSSCVPRDTFQSSMRPRYIKNNLLKYSIETQNIKTEDIKKQKIIENEIQNIEDKKELLLKITKEEIKNNENKEIKNNENKENNECNLELIKSLESTPKILKDILLFNKYEDYLSKNHYKEMFEHFLLICGYEITRLEKPDKKKKIQKKDTSEYENKYLEIKIVSNEEIIKLQKKIKDNEATEKDKLESSKYFFNLIIKNNDDNKKSSELFFDYYCSTFGKNLLLNSSLELNSETSKLIMKTLLKSEIEENINLNGVKLMYIKKIVKMMKLKNSQDNTKIIDKKILTDVYKYLNENDKDIRTAFNFKQNDVVINKDDKTFCNKYFHLLNEIFKNWNGLNLKPNEKDNKSNSAKNYILNGTCFINDIKNTKKKIDLTKYNF